MGINQNALSSRTIWISVDKTGWIQEIKTRGPIVTPILVPSRIVLKMVQNGRKVYEHNPQNKHQKVLLTVQNFDKVKIWNEDGTVTITKNIIGQTPKAEIEEAIVNPFSKNKAVQTSATQETEEVKDAKISTVFSETKKEETASEVAEEIKEEVKVEEVVEAATVEAEVVEEVKEVEEKSETPVASTEETATTTQTNQQQSNKQNKKNKNK